jgi:ribonuclease T1
VRRTTELRRGRALAGLAALAIGALAVPGPARAREAAPAAAPVVGVAELPSEGRETLALIEAGGPFPYRKDGAVFGNYERALPAKPRGYYREYTVRTPGAHDRGARRIIAGRDGDRWYSADHYRTFRRIER